MKSSPKSEPAGGEAGGLGGRRIGKQPSGDYTAGAGKLLRKWQAIRAAASDKRLSAAADLRVLVAILDRMNDRLEAWPGYGTIGRDVGVDRRTASRSVDRLIEAGYLVKDRTSKHSSNTYRLIHLSVDSPTGNDTNGVSVDPSGVSVNPSGGGVGESVRGVSVDSPHEPGNRTRAPLNPEKEAGAGNPARAREDQPATPPFEEIRQAYNELLPDLPEALRLTSERKKLIRQRWEKELKGIDRWRAYFKSIHESPFLMGQKPPGPNRSTPFQADFDFLIREQTVVNHAEGKYMDPEPVRSGGGASRRYLD